MTDWDETTNAIGVALSGDKPEGKRLLMTCWNDTDSNDHAQRCVLAHYLADVEDDLDLEIGWDEMALAEHAHIQETGLAHLGITSARGMKPSLNLNLGDGYLRRGEGILAEEQLAAGLDSVDALELDGYGAMIRNGLENLAQRCKSCS